MRQPRKPRTAADARRYLANVDKLTDGLIDYASDLYHAERDGYWRGKQITRARAKLARLDRELLSAVAAVEDCVIHSSVPEIRADTETIIKATCYFPRDEEWRGKQPRQRQRENIAWLRETLKWREAE